jgi:Holliday junction resolvasome RuvABC endonuclease subunit
MQTMSDLYVLGLDPGFANIGYAVTRLTAKGVEPISMGLIKTKKSDKKLNVLSADDNFRRGKEIAKALQALVLNPPGDAGKIIAICAERKSFPRNASAAAKVAMCWGVMCMLAVDTGLPVISASPQEIKLSLCGKANASKIEIQSACIRSFSQDITELVKGIAKSSQEHPYDALATVLACSDSETLCLARRMATL